MAFTGNENLPRFTGNPLAEAIFGDLIGQTKYRLGVKEGPTLPRSSDELSREIMARLKSTEDLANKARLQTILEVSKHGSFQRALELYAKHFQSAGEEVVA